MSKWLVTGGAGFIGSHIVEKLVSMGEKVRVLDNFVTGKEKYIGSVVKKIDLIKGDIRDTKIVGKAVREIDYVLHQAALRSVPRSVEMPQECNSVNVEGTLNCLLASAKAKVKRFVLASSSSIYGNSDKFPQRETDLPSPISPYAVSKIAGEYYCQVFKETYGLSTVSLRYFNVFGERQDPKSTYAAVIPRFIIAALKDAPLGVHWDGKQSRDFTHVANVVKANILSAKEKKLKGMVYNIGCGGSISLLEIIRLLEKIIGKKLQMKFSSKRAGDVRKTMSSIALAKRDFHFSSEVSFADGLERTFNYFQENG